ncbi:hypothetical protein bcgnr5378_29110 [Bacillus cereus]
MRKLSRKALIALSVCGLFGSAITVVPQEASAFSFSKEKREQEALHKRQKQIVKYNENAFEVKKFMVGLQKLKKQGKLSPKSDAYSLVSYIETAAPYSDISQMNKFEIVNYMSYHPAIKKKQLASAVQVLEPAIQLVYNWTGKNGVKLAKNKGEQLINFCRAAGKAASKGNNFTYDDIKNIKM